MPPCVSAWKIRPVRQTEKLPRAVLARNHAAGGANFLENACVLLMGVLSTFLVSWLGKEAMAGVGLADSFNMVIIAFSPRWISAPPWWWPSASASAIVGARARARQSPVLMTGVALLLAAGIHLAGESIIDVIAGAASPEVKALALSYLQTTVWSYPAAAIALIGSGALRARATPRSRC